MNNTINPLKIQEVKHIISQEFGISESQIDESVLGIYLCLKTIKDSDTTQFENLKKEFATTNVALSKIKEFRKVEYSNPKTAFFGEFGRLGIGLFGIAILLSVVITTIFNSSTNRRLIHNLKKLDSVIEPKAEGYFISSKSVKKTDGGYLIITD